MATEGFKNKVNDKVRKFHELFGKGSKPPFFIDHSGGKIPLFITP